MAEITGQTAAWLDLMRAGDQTARQGLIEHSCQRLRGLARKMLRRYNLIWYEQLTQEQAAEVLGVTARTVRRRWQDARYRLQKARLGEPLPEE